MHGGSALHIPIDVRHRLVNEGTETAVSSSISARSPRGPELGHVDTESAG